MENLQVIVLKRVLKIKTYGGCSKSKIAYETAIGKTANSVFDQLKNLK
jgi:hypothetical protein